MSDQNFSDDDAWGHGTPHEEPAPAFGEGSHGLGIGDEPEQAHGTREFVDSEVREIQPKAKKGKGPLVFLVVAGVIVIGVAGTAVHNLYRKFVPAPQAAEVTAAERGVDAQAAGRGSDALGGEAATLAGQVGSAPGMVIGGADAAGGTASAVPSAAPASSAAAAVVVAPPMDAPKAMLAQAPELPTKPPVVTAPPIVPAPAVVVAPAAATPAPPAPVVIVPAPPAAAPSPATAAPVAVASVTTAPMATGIAKAPPTSVAARAGAAPREERQTPAVKPRSARHASRAHPPAAASKKDRPDPTVEPIKVASRPAPAAPKAKRLKAGASSESGEPVAPKGNAEVAEKTAAGVLSSYKIESISPQHGEHQMAWVRNSAGHLKVISAGDTYEGMRVQKVDASRFVVQTSQGEIR